MNFMPTPARHVFQQAVPQEFTDGLGIYSPKSSTFATHLVFMSRQACEIKRESGENPGQFPLL
jgi:hypothetical protein